MSFIFVNLQLSFHLLFYILVTRKHSFYSVGLKLIIASKLQKRWRTWSWCVRFACLWHASSWCLIVGSFHERTHNVHVRVLKCRLFSSLSKKRRKCHKILEGAGGSMNTVTLFVVRSKLQSAMNEWMNQSIKQLLSTKYQVPNSKVTR